MKSNRVNQSEKNKDDTNARSDLRSVVTSKSVLLSALICLAAGWLWLIEPARGSTLASLKPYAPAAVSLAGSFLVGLIIGGLARRKLDRVLIVGGVVVVAVALLAKLGIIGPAVNQWVHSAVGWISNDMSKVQSYIAALLPSASAAGSGLYLGFRNRK